VSKNRQPHLQSNITGKSTGNSDPFALAKRFAARNSAGLSMPCGQNSLQSETGNSSQPNRGSGSWNREYCPSRFSSGQKSSGTPTSFWDVLLRTRCFRRRIDKVLLGRCTDWRADCRNYIRSQCQTAKFRSSSENIFYDKCLRRERNTSSAPALKVNYVLEEILRFLAASEIG
jgi:hypothetical protein